MKRFGLICLAVILTACGQASTATPDTNSIASVPETPQPLTLENIDFSSYSEDLAKFVDLEIGEDSWASIDKMRLYFAPEDGKTILQTKTSKFDRPDGSVLIYTVSGLKDDSVKAEELFMIFAGESDAQKLAAYGSKIKCHRGENTTQWQTKPCP